MPRASIAPDLLSDLPIGRIREPIGEGAVVLRRLAASSANELMRAIEQVCAASPFRRMVTPGGHTMSVAMTNCGELGWVTDRRGYRYQSVDPLSDEPWPAMPALLTSIASEAARQGGYRQFAPDACLINRYEPGARLSLHQDRNERDLRQPIVSISYGLPAVFLFGGMQRNDRPRRIRLDHGDVVVWGGATRLVHHGIEPLEEGVHPVTGRSRINLTLRKAG